MFVGVHFRVASLFPNFCRLSARSYSLECFDNSESSPDRDSVNGTVHWRCPVWFVLRKFSANKKFPLKKFSCSQWALADHCLGAFILEGKMKVLLRILLFSVEKNFP